MKSWPSFLPNEFTSSKQLLRASREYLSQNTDYEFSEVVALSNSLLSQLSQLNSAQILADYPLDLSEQQRDVFIQQLYRLAQYEPIQYIHGETHFLGRSFWLNPSVLIPRPETEELCHKLILQLQAKGIDQNTNPHLRGIDLGTGSACIAISLAKELPHLHMSGLDISTPALQLAYWNAWRHDIRLNWIQGDLLDPSSLHFLSKPWDLIVSNPPYVLESDRKHMQANVLDFEPSLALFVPDEDPLVFYQAILRLAVQCLKPGGLIAWEIHEKMGEAIAQLLQKSHYTHIRIEKDLFGKDRFAFAQKAR